MELPTKEQILAYLTSQGTTMTKRELVDAFNISGNDRIGFKKIIHAMEDEGLITYEGKKSYRVPDALPAVTVVEVIDIDIDGDEIATPVDWDETTRGKAPRIEIMPADKGRPALKVGDMALVQLAKVSEKVYEARVLKRVDSQQARVVGLIKQIRGGYVLQPIDRRAKYDFDISEKDFNGAAPGLIVVAEMLPSRGALRKKVRTVEIVGRPEDPKAISMMALHEMGLRHTFPEDVIASTDNMAVPELKGRDDLRSIPLVTIDGSDARDFDDAVFAEPDESPKNPGGYHLVVAIADVSYYVRPGKPLDKEAYLRGNSTYFPDRVVPMLPEKLSNDLCSLRPNEPRATLAVHMWIDAAGKLLKYKFVRGLMKSIARLTYEQVQDARNGNPDETTTHLMDHVIEPLYAAWKVLDAAREKRGALDLDVPERKIAVNKEGIMTGVAVRARLDSHRLIEEFMILANVAAALALEAKQAPCVYRIHDRPTGDKLMAARTFLEAFGLSLPKTGVAEPKQINHVLKQAKELPAGFLINEIILRSQAQAQYNPENIGHFGLALQHYAHFTSPIRRYADLVVHRSLIKAYDLGEGELSDVEAAKLDEIAAHISSTERVSAEAERNSVDRFTAAFLKDKLGTEFTGRIGGVTRFGLFVKLDQTAADGLVPIRSLPDDYYMHDEGQHALIGRRTGRVFRLGAAVTVRVVEADTLTGSTVLELVNGEAGADVEGYKGRVYIPEAPGRRGGRNDRGGGSHRKGGGRDSGKRDDRKPRHPEGRNGKGSTRDGGGKSGSSGSRGNAGGGGRGGPSRGGKKGGKPGNPRKNPR
jgi:ribonuclease R